MSRSILWFEGGSLSGNVQELLFGPIEFCESGAGEFQFLGVRKLIWCVTVDSVQ